MDSIILFGTRDCHKVRFYMDALQGRGLAFRLAEVDRDAEAARHLTELTGNADRFPTLLIAGRKLRNPSLIDLDKALARAGLHDPGLVHDEKGQRLVRWMAPRDAFVSYRWQGERMILTHAEVAPELQGQGFGTRLATDAFDMLAPRSHDIRLACPFLIRVARTRPEWRARFGLEA